MEQLYKINMHFDNIDKYYHHSRPMVEIIYTAYFNQSYNDVVKIFNDNVDLANYTWSQTGKQTAFGKYIEDINPEYVECLRQSMKTAFDLYNATSKVNSVIRYEIDDYGCIRAYMTKHPDVKIWFDMTPVTEEA